MSTSREIDGKREFAANGNEALGNISIRNRPGVPCVNEKKDGFKGGPDGITSVCHDVKPFIQISIDALNEHRIVVVARQNMIIDVEEVEGFLEHTHKLGVLVKDDRVAKAVSENDVHEGRGECLCFEIGSIAAKEHIPQHAMNNEVYFGAFKTFDSTGLKMQQLRCTSLLWHLCKPNF